MIPFLHVNAILKTEDPIAATQTDPILYDKKMEEEKDGVKAAATPKIVYYGGQGFLTKKPVSKYEKEITAASSGKKKEKFNWSDWWEDKPADSSSTTGETVPESTETEDIQLAAPDAEPLTEETLSSESVPMQAPLQEGLSAPPARGNTPEEERAPEASDDWW